MGLRGSCVGHLILFFISIIISSILRIYGNQIAEHLGLLQQCLESGEAMCFGNQAVYRVSFALFAFFTTTTLLSWATGEDQSGWWCIKLPLYLVLVFSTFFISNDFFNAYVDFTRGASGIFIIVQIVVLIDFAYGCQDYLLEKIEASAISISEYQANRLFFWRTAYLILSFGGVIGCIIACIFMRNNYHCDLATAFITVTLVSCLMISVASVYGPVSVGLLPASVMSMCITMGCWQSLNSIPDPQCRPTATLHGSNNETILPSVALAALSLTWTSWRISSAIPSAFMISSEAKSEQLNVLLTSEGGTTEAVSTASTVLKKEESIYWHFYAIMSLASCYMAMVLTGWGSVNSATAISFNMTNVWIKIISQWITIVIYIWTLIAPLILRDREFPSVFN